MLMIFCTYVQYRVLVDQPARSPYWDFDRITFRSIFTPIRKAITRSSSMPMSPAEDIGTTRGEEGKLSGLLLLLQSRTVVSPRLRSQATSCTEASLTSRKSVFIIQLNCSRKFVGGGSSRFVKIFVIPTICSESSIIRTSVQGCTSSLNLVRR